MDIEKPASTAKRYEFIWRVPLAYDEAKYSSWIKHHEVADQGQVKVEIAYPFHFRYQPAREAVNTTKV